MCVLGSAVPAGRHFVVLLLGCYIRFRLLKRHCRGRLAPQCSRKPIRVFRILVVELQAHRASAITGWASMAWTNVPPTRNAVNAATAYTPMQRYFSAGWGVICHSKYAKRGTI